MRNLLVCAIVIFGIWSCKHDPFLAEQLIDNGGIDPVDECDPDSIYFANQILPLFVSSCAISGCHDAVTAEDDMVLDSYDNILGSGEIIPFNTGEGDIYEVITESDPDDIMPPPPESPLSQEQIDMIGLWISQGAQNNGCDGCDYPVISFSATVFPLIQNKCEGCHSGAEPDGNTLLTNYDEVKFLVDNEYLIQVMNW
ncbi:MAG: hypothetical protein HKO93_05020, partial [Flavobacteriales bacterium]|nr:hypothetical protein [Flavobacteriales bacterium]